MYDEDTTCGGTNGGKEEKNNWSDYYKTSGKIRIRTLMMK
jgi:hypothetical protein